MHVSKLLGPDIEKALERMNPLNVRHWLGYAGGGKVPPENEYARLLAAMAAGEDAEARFHAILKPQAMVERGGLFRGAIEDCYVGAFFDPALRTRFEKAIHALVARNGLEKDRDADLVVEAAE